MAERHSNKSKNNWYGYGKDMIKKAKIDNKKNNLEFINGDFLNTKLGNSSLIICYYTLQFVSPAIRQLFVNKIFDSLSWGGAFILYEKVRAPDARFQDYMVQIYNEYKLKVTSR